MPENDAIRSKQDPRPKWFALLGYLVTAVLEILVTLGLIALEPIFPLYRHAIYYVLTVGLVAYWFGLGPAILAFLLGLGLSDYFFVAPRHTLWPPATTIEGWARFTAYFTGSFLVALLILAIRNAKQKVESLAAAREELAAIVETSEDAIIGKDLTGIITSWNSGAERLYGYTRDEAVGRRVTILAAPGHEDDIAEILGKIARGEPMKHYETQRLCKDGRIVDVSLAVSPVRNAAGVVTGASTIARDITELVRLRRALENQVRLLQKALMPRSKGDYGAYHVASKYLPGAEGQDIGGDFFDSLETEACKLAFLIGDVAGKGVEAAALAASSRSTLRAFLYEITSSDVSLAHANTVLQSQHSDPGKFITAFVVAIDPETGEMQYAGAGHPPAAILRTGGTVEFLASSNPPVGVFENITFTSSRNTLRTGEKLVLYTDGIFESRDSSGDLFDIDGVRRVLTEHYSKSPEDLCEALVAAAQDWAGGRLHDDAAVLIVERR